MSLFPRADSDFILSPEYIAPTFSADDFKFKEILERPSSIVDNNETTIHTPPKIFSSSPTSLAISLKFLFTTAFEKFHVTQHSRAGFNKIYHTRRSRSFFFEIVDHLPSTNQINLKIYTNDYHMSSIPMEHISTSNIPNHKFQISKCLTHFFSAQRVIPRRLQEKFFQLIRKKLLERIDFIRSRGQKKDNRNHMTKTFFNFSYKKYRFYFGIFIPCDFSLSDNSLMNNIIKCSIPVPFVMSENRHGCIAHHNKIQLRSRNQVKNPDEINISLESKDFHARRLHNRWIHGRTKNNFSKRLGITFNTRYSVNNINNILRKGNTYIYNKIYENFNFGFSKKNNVQRKQRQRFDRKCKHVFRNCDTKDDTLTEDKLLSSKRQGFLFHPLQSYKKCISHLRYKKRYQVPLQKYYNFKLPTLNTKSSDPEVKREVHIAHYFESNRHGSSLDPSYKTESTLDTPVASTANNTWNQTVSSSSLLNINAAPFTPKTVTQKGKKKRKEPIISDKDFLSTLRTFNEEQRNRANNKREGTSTSQVKNFIPDDLLPFIPDEPIYKDGKVYSLLTKKEKATLKPLTEGSKSWRVAIRSIKDAADRKRELETYKDNLALKWETTRYAGEFCEEFTSDLFYVQNSYYDFFTYKNRVDHVTPIDETKGKKPIQNNKNIDSPAFARQHLEELESKKEDSDLILALFLRQQSLYNHIPPEFFVPRERKRRAIDSSNFDYNLHRKKRSRHDIDFSI